ncbi:MAG: glycosyltransferase family 39 protein [Anaerolineae bacterium]|nr:glycosyltransferase family 39 protein [Anaerolineae bacterium]
MIEMDRRVFWRGMLLFVVLLAFAIRVSGLTAQSMWRDEIDALAFSQAPLSALLGNFSRAGWNGPLFYLLLRPWVAAAGRSEFGLRYFSLWFGVLGVALLYRLGKSWLSRPVGALAALLMAVAPYMVWYAQELKMYALVSTLVLVTLILYHRAVHGSDWRIWTMVIGLTWVTAGVHIMGGLLVLVLVGLFFAWWPVTRMQWPVALTALLGIALPGLLVAPWVLPLLFRGGNIGHHFVSLGSMVQILLHAFSQGITSFGGSLPIGVIVFGMLAGTALWPDLDRAQIVERVLQGLAKRSTPEATNARPGQLSQVHHVLALWVWLVVPVLGLYAISLRVPMFVDRYLIWIGPALYLLVARGIEQLGRRLKALGVLYLALVLFFAGWGIGKQVSAPIKSDFRAAAAYVRQHRQANELVLFHISYVRQTFEYYYGDSMPYADGIPSDDRTSEADVDAAMRERVAGYDTLWLVLSEPEMWDQRGMTVAWLDRHARVAQQDFARVSVIQYHLSPPSQRDSP